MKIIKSLLLIVLLVTTSLASAQIPSSPLYLKSPNVASLGLFGEVPVSLFTGIPQISIPIFQAPAPYENLSINLSYHAGGVRPDQHPGWVGMNWALSAGGSITRNTRGIEDEFKAMNADQSIISYWGYYYSSNAKSMLSKNDWDNSDNIKTVATMYKTNVNHFEEAEPDEFSFNFGQYNGTFYFNENNELVVNCDKPLKVVFDGNFIDVPDELIYKKNPQASVKNFIYAYQASRTKTFNSFSIYTEDGTRYIFGNDPLAIEYSINFFHQLDVLWAANTWHLTKVVYPNGKSVTLNYERGSLINQLLISKYVVLDSKKRLISSNKSTDIGCNDFHIDLNLYNSYTGRLISPVYLKSIESPDFSVTFSSGTSYELQYEDAIYNGIINETYKHTTGLQSGDYGYLGYLGNVSEYKGYLDLIRQKLDWRALGAIYIYDNNKKLVDQYNFKYYNSAAATGNPRYTSTERLFLKTLSRKNTSRSYTFEYDNKDKLPPYLANKTDHWGFFNNKLAYFGDSDKLDSYYSLREPDSTVMRHGILKKIFYPTGGSSEFIFETNQYSKQLKVNRWEGVEVTTNKITGGLRIKKIINDSNDGSTPTFKEYYYINGYSPAKQTGTSSGVLGGQSQYLFKDYEVIAPDQGLLSPYSTIKGDLVMTNKIFSTQSILPACQNSKGSHIGYSEVVEKLSDGSYTKYKFSNFDNGYLDEKFNQTLQLTLTPYQQYNLKEQERGNLLVKEVYDSSGKIKYRETNNYVKSNSNYVKSISAKSVYACVDLGMGYFEGTIYKNYLYSMLLSNRKEAFYSNTDSIVKTTSYKYDTNYPLLVQQTENTSIGEELSTVYTYPFHIQNSYLAQSPLTPSSYPQRAVRSALYNTCRSMYNANFINFPVEIVNYRNKNVIGSQLIHYGKHGSDFLPDSVYKLETKIPLIDFLRLGTTGYEGYADARYEKRPSESYLYDKNSNLLEITKKGIFKTTYLWGYANFYPVAQIVNASYAQVSSKLGGDDAAIQLWGAALVPSDEYISKINALRSQNALPNAHVTNNTFKPLIGMTSATDASGVKTTYEYDSSNRLEFVKDNRLKVMESYKYGKQVTAIIEKNGITAQSIPDVAQINIYPEYGCQLDWYLINSAGNVVQSLSGGNSSVSTFNFTCPQAGNYTLKCVLSQSYSAFSKTVTKSIVSLPLTAELNPDFKLHYWQNKNVSVGVTVNAGSGKYTYSWSLKNSSGTALASLINSSQSYWNFTCSQTGTFDFQCVVKDTQTGYIFTVLKKISVYEIAKGTITTDKTEYYSVQSTGMQAASTGNATITRSGGSGNTYCSWSLLDSSGNVMQSSTGQNTFQFVCTKQGTLTLRCIIIDGITGDQTVVTKSFASK